MIAILGTGTLARSLASKVTARLFSRAECDLLQPISDNVIAELKNYHTIINCAGINTGSTNNIIQTNFVGPVNLIEKLNNVGYAGRAIMIGSHGASWTSWPGIAHERLVYNTSKESLRNFVKGFAQSGLSKMKLSIIEPTKFQSPMSNHQGTAVESVADAIIKILQITDINVLHVEIDT